MGTKKKTWAQKWADAKAKTDLPKVMDCPEAGKQLLIPSPSEIEDIVRGIPSGQVVRLDEITARLASKHTADLCCPMTTGIFLWVMAHAASEAETGDKDIPWWRVVKSNGELNPKYPGAPELQRSLLEAEGRLVQAKGKKLIVA